jgi:hypothetical protein
MKILSYDVPNLKGINQRTGTKELSGINSLEATECDEKSSNEFEVTYSSMFETEGRATYESSPSVYNSDYGHSVSLNYDEIKPMMSFETQMYDPFKIICNEDRFVKMNEETEIVGGHYGNLL